MLDPHDAGRRLQMFFDEANDEEIPHTSRRATPDAQEEALTPTRERFSGPTSNKSVLGPEHVGTLLREHFATVSNEEFLANVRRYNPDFALEMGLGTLADPKHPDPRHHSGCIDPELGRKAIREYHATTPIEQQIDDLRRWSPALAERLGVNEPFVPYARPSNRIRGFFASFGRSVQRLFS